MLGVALALLAGACHIVDPNTPSPASASGDPPTRSATTHVYACGDYAFVARVEGEQVWLFLPSGTVAVPRVVSGSGAKYSDGSVTYWSKGQEALLELPDRTLTECVRDPRRSVWEHAKLEGVDFRAVGNEPGWLLEIRNGLSILLVSDYGARRDRFPAPEPRVEADAARTRYETREGDHRLTVVLEGGSCRDSMSGEAFETRVTVTLDGRTLRGCGRALH